MNWIWTVIAGVALLAEALVLGKSVLHARWVTWKPFSDVVWDWARGSRGLNTWRGFVVLAVCVWLLGHLAFGWWR